MVFTNGPKWHHNTPLETAAPVTLEHTRTWQLPPVSWWWFRWPAGRISAASPSSSDRPAPPTECRCLSPQGCSAETWTFRGFSSSRQLRTPMHGWFLPSSEPHMQTSHMYTMLKATSHALLSIRKYQRCPYRGPLCSHWQDTSITADHTMSKRCGSDFWGGQMPLPATNWYTGDKHAPFF